MRSLGTRRAALVTGFAAVAAVALAGCSAGQVAETALKKPSNMGVNAENSNNTVAIRNLTVQYDGTEGFAAGDAVPIEVGLFNQTKNVVTVLVSSRPLAGAGPNQGVVSAQSVGLVGGSSATPSTPSSAIPEPSGSRPSGGQDDQQTEQLPAPDPSSGTAPSAAPSAAGAPARPAQIKIAPLSSVTFLPGDTEQLQAVGLTGKLLPGQSVNLVFEFDNGADPLELQASVGIPLSPASRAPGLPPEEHLGEGEGE